MEPSQRLGSPAHISELKKGWRGPCTHAGSQVSGLMPAPCLQITCLLTHGKCSHEVKDWAGSYNGVLTMPGLLLGGTEWCGASNLYPGCDMKIIDSGSTQWGGTGDRGPPCSWLTSGVAWWNVELMIVGEWGGKVHLQLSWEPRNAFTCSEKLEDLHLWHLMLFWQNSFFKLKKGTARNVAIKPAN